MTVMPDADSPRGAHHAARGADRGAVAAPARRTVAHGAVHLADRDRRGTAAAAAAGAAGRGRNRAPRRRAPSAEHRRCPGGGGRRAAARGDRRHGDPDARHERRTGPRSAPPGRRRPATRSSVTCTSPTRSPGPPWAWCVRPVGTRPVGTRARPNRRCWTGCWPSSRTCSAPTGCGSWIGTSPACRGSRRCWPPAATC